MGLDLIASRAVRFINEVSLAPLAPKRALWGGRNLC
ncbi:hypothetical protein FF011L_20550 [Roseimaritima multifibrata]|uniref:Uncharacterized protein n=1 Tax=Roseimaritima multifibrata TaxID=1930274 RepID=A0A517MEI7_9BACT|nr:hypothetical protein FF011L_20550 [Roseimaritima multifibrata]